MDECFWHRRGHWNIHGHGNKSKINEDISSALIFSSVRIQFFTFFTSQWTVIHQVTLSSLRYKTRLKNKIALLCHTYTYIQKVFDLCCLPPSRRYIGHQWQGLDSNSRKLRRTWKWKKYRTSVFENFISKELNGNIIRFC